MWCLTPLGGGSRVGELLDGHYRYDYLGCAAKARAFLGVIPRADPAAAMAYRGVIPRADPAAAMLDLLDRELAPDVSERERTPVRLGDRLMPCDVCVGCWRFMWSSSRTSFGAKTWGLLGWRPFSPAGSFEASCDSCFVMFV